MIYGNIEGIRESLLKEMETLYDLQLEENEFAPAPLCELMARYTCMINREISIYLSRSGEDNDHYYDVKIKASQLLLDNIENTFVTPVFNGSTSLRDAAGQMIEEVTKAVRRKKEVNDAFIDTLYTDMTALYRLNQREGDGSLSPEGKSDLGPLPRTSVLLLGTLASVWALMIAYVVIVAIKKRGIRPPRR